jgi:DNA polymerase-4
LPSATLIAKQIKAQILDQTGLTSSAGISYCKFLAKTASDMNKPNGLYVILPHEASDFIDHLPVKKIFGIGSVTAKKMQHMGIFTGKDLKNQTLGKLTRRFGKSGQYYYDISRGLDNRPVNPDRERKSISAERTFDNDLMNMVELKQKLSIIIEEVYNRYQNHGAKGKTLTLKIKYGDFHQITRSHTLDSYLESKDELIKQASSLFQKDLINENGIRLLGLGISNFQKPTNETQLTLSF